MRGPAAPAAVQTARARTRGTAGTARRTPPALGAPHLTARRMLDDYLMYVPDPPGGTTA
ncbi:hypothetical protein GCM10009751_15350 [Myceligenerans crystallogenes]|uniref:Uncharacterized protein n=2 Tax=Myceligenerans crystallogenes TaxID=316335 RepID=A0ABP4ZKW4_9MICO